nr:helix-turn-helix domain-containing protein [Brevibacterium otitidis]
MRMHNDDMEPSSSRPRLDPWWEETLSALAAQVPQLAAEFVSLLREEVPGYAHLSSAEVTETAEQSLGLLIGRLAGHASAAKLRALSEDLGSRRTAQGIELDEMIAAIRLDFRVLWSGLIRSVAQEDAAQLLAHAEDVLETVEEYSSYAQRAYLKEAEALAADTAVQTRRMLTHFLSADDPLPLTDRVAKLTGFSPQAHFTVWAMRADAESDLLHRCGQSLRRQRLRHHWSAVEETTVVIVEAEQPPDRPDLTDESVLEIGAVAGLSDVPAAATRARELVGFAEPGSWATERDVWVPFLHKHLAAGFPEQQSAIRAGLATLSPDERERVIVTVLTYLGCGSTQRTAERSYVHRNTVLNRLRLFRECTGLDVTVPIEAAAALLALGRPVPPMPG